MHVHYRHNSYQTTGSSKPKVHVPYLQPPTSYLWSCATEVRRAASGERRAARARRGEARLREDSSGPQAWVHCRECCVSGGKQIIHMGGSNSRSSIGGTEAYEKADVLADAASYLLLCS